MDISYTQISETLIGVYLFLYGLEWAILAKKKSLTSLFDKKAILLRLQDRNFLKAVLKVKWVQALLGIDKFAITFAIVLSFFGISLIVLSSLNFVNGFYLFLIFLSYLFFNSFIGFGFEGSDQMASIVLFCLTITHLIPNAEYISNIFLVTQIVLSYVVSGIAKLASKHWRDGRAIVMILSTNSFGMGNANWLNRNKPIAKLICILVIIFEIGWLALPFNPYIAFGLIILGILFHLVNSYLMGLNLFLWSFAAAYPLALKAFMNF